MIHFHPLPFNGNVRCLNGSAHVSYSYDIKDVTCPLCKDKNTARGFWLNAIKKERRLHPLQNIEFRD